MDKQSSHFLYRPQSVLDEAQKIPGLTLVCLHAILVPLWRVELEGTFNEQKPYALLEKYVEHGIFDGKLQTIEELSAFFGIDPRLIAKVLDFLQTIEHVQCEQGRWFLRPLGEQSLREGQKHIPKKSRQEFLFEAFRGLPLMREHYEKMQIYTEQEAGELVNAYESGRRGYRCQRLYSFHTWNESAVEGLARRSDRDQYNLRMELSGVHRVGQGQPEQVYLPLYLVEARKQNSQPVYLAYSRIRGRRDQFFEGIANNYPDIRQSLAATAEVGQQHKDYWSRWLERQGLAGVRPLYMPNGIWQLNLEANLFHRPNPPLAIDQIGTYHLEDGHFLYIWCDDVEIRRYAALDRTLRLIERYKKTITEREVEKNLQLFSEQLATRQLDLDDLKRRAKETDRTALLGVIDAL